MAERAESWEASVVSACATRLAQWGASAPANHLPATVAIESATCDRGTVMRFAVRVASVGGVEFWSGPQIVPAPRDARDTPSAMAAYLFPCNAPPAVEMTEARLRIPGRVPVPLWPASIADAMPIDSFAARAPGAEKDAGAAVSGGGGASGDTGEDSGEDDEDTDEDVAEVIGVGAKGTVSADEVAVAGGERLGIREWVWPAIFAWLCALIIFAVAQVGIPQ